MHSHILWEVPSGNGWTHGFRDRDSFEMRQSCTSTIFYLRAVAALKKDASMICKPCWSCQHVCMFSRSAEATSYYLNPNIVASWTGGWSIRKCHKSSSLWFNGLRHGGTLQQGSQLLKSALAPARKKRWNSKEVNLRFTTRSENTQIHSLTF